MKFFVLIMLFFIPFSAFAEPPRIDVSSLDAPKLDKKVPVGNAFYSVSAFSEEDGYRSGLEISILINTSPKYASRISGVLYSARNEEKLMDAFAGFSYTGYLHLNQKYINPYIGMGVFAGDTFKCSEDDEENDKCEEEGIFTIYPEIGIAINVGKLHVFPYVRRYNFNDNNTYGLNIGLGF